jgi:hypothetical protein
MNIDNRELDSTDRETSFYQEKGVGFLKAFLSEKSFEDLQNKQIPTDRLQPLKNLYFDYQNKVEEILSKNSFFDTVNLDFVFHPDKFEETLEDVTRGIPNEKGEEIKREGLQRLEQQQQKRVSQRIKDLIVFLEDDYKLPNKETLEIIRSSSGEEKIQTLVKNTQQNKEKYEPLVNTLRQIIDILEQLERMAESLLLGGKEGDILQKIAQKPRIEEVFKKIKSILQLIEEKEISPAEDLNIGGFGENRNFEALYSPTAREIQVYNKTILKRAQNLLEKISQTDPEDYDMILSESESFQEKVIAWGARLKELRSQGFDHEEIVAQEEDISIKKQSGGNIVSRDENGNFVFSEHSIFDKKAYEFLTRQIHEACKTIAPQWEKHLIDSIPNDLNDPDASWIVIRDTKRDKIVGTTKMKPHPTEENALYVGSMYVDPAYQKGFDVGKQLQEMWHSIAPGARYIGSVAKNNPALQRHVEAGNGILTKILHEGVGIKESDKLFETEFQYKGTYASKKLKAEDIAEMATVNGFKMCHSPNGKDILAYEINGALEQDVAFVQLCAEKFSEGFALTRLFYDRADLSHGYAVFEQKPQRGSGI